MREMSREKQGSLAGAMGIGVNILLFVIKLMAGLLSGSVAIMSTAVVQPPQLQSSSRLLRITSPPAPVPSYQCPRRVSSMI